MKFYNKALTLKKIRTKKAIIPQLIIIKGKDFYKNKKQIIKKITSFLKNNLLIVRSSSQDEDTNFKSNAGRFESIPMVKNEENDLDIAINKVFNSYKKNKKKFHHFYSKNDF